MNASVVTANVSDSDGSANDGETLVSLRAGDPATFRRVVSELNPGLTRLAQTYVPASIADEVVQETWAAVIESLDSFEGKASLKTWIYRIMLNKVRTLAKRESKIIPFAAMGHGREDDGTRAGADHMTDKLLSSGFWPAASAPWHRLPAERLESEEVLMMILDAIASLPGAQREVVELRDVQGWPADEVCQALGISSANQRVLLHRGRSAVRMMLEEYLSNDG